LFLLAYPKISRIFGLYLSIKDMATYYYKGKGFQGKNDSGVSVDGCVDAKSASRALVEIRKAIGLFHFDTIVAWNGENGKVIAQSQYNQPISKLNGEFVWMRLWKH
jgi:hypothetical protein